MNAPFTAQTLAGQLCDHHIKFHDENDAAGNPSPWTMTNRQDYAIGTTINRGIAQLASRSERHAVVQALEDDYKYEMRRRKRTILACSDTHLEKLSDVAYEFKEEEISDSLGAWTYTESARHGREFGLEVLALSNRGASKEKGMEYIRVYAQGMEAAKSRATSAEEASLQTEKKKTIDLLADLGQSTEAAVKAQIATKAALERAIINNNLAVARLQKCTEEQDELRDDLVQLNTKLTALPKRSTNHEYAMAYLHSKVNTGTLKAMTA